MKLTFRRLAARWRDLLRRPGFLLPASLALALGVAAVTAAFTLVDGLLLHHPPFPEHARVVLYGEGSAERPIRYISPLLYRMIGTPTGVESRGSARLPEKANVRVGGHTYLVQAQRMDDGFLPTLGVRPSMGRGLIATSDGAVVSQHFWHTALGGRSDALGRSIVVNGRKTVVLGVMPSDYRLFNDVDVLLPLDLDRQADDNAANLLAIARLGPGASVNDFSRHVDRTAHENAHALRLTSANPSTFGATPLDEQVTLKARPTLLIFLGCAILVMIVSALNLSGLMLVRAIDRAHETAIRVALGAHGWHPWRQAMEEAALIGGLAIVAGLPLGSTLADMLLRFLPDAWLLAERSTIPDVHVYLLVSGTAVLTLAVAVMGSSSYEHSDSVFLERFSAGRRGGADSPTHHVRRTMAVVQCTLATMLLVLSVSTAMRLWRLERVPLGFDSQHALVFEFKADDAQFPRVADVVTMSSAVRHRLLRLPGIDAVGLSSYLPVTGRFVMPFSAPGGVTRYVQYALVTPGALEAMGLHLVRGRSLNDGDLPGRQRVALVNEAYLNVFGGGTGSMVMPASQLSPNEPLRIEGVVADTRHAGPDLPPEPTVFVPLAQAWDSSFAFVRMYMPMYMALRGPGAEGLNADAIAEAVHDVVPFVAAGNPLPMWTFARDALEKPRRDAVFAGVFAMLAMTLAGIGLYASQAVDVATRRHDFALRCAFGARPADLLRLVLMRHLGTGAVGIVVGLLAAVYIHDWVANAVIDAEDIDATVFFSVSLVMMIATLFTGGLPALRAARIDPLHAMRGG